MPHGKPLQVESPEYGSFEVYPNQVISKATQGTIVEGRELSSGNAVVAKISQVYPKGFSDDKSPADKTHLLQEANILEQIDDIDGVPAYHGLHRLPEKHGERLVLIMEKIPGVNIQDYAKSLPGYRFTAMQALSFLRKAAEILDRVHKRNVIHCDLKFSNFMISQNEDISIIDWGSSQFFGEDGGNIRSRKKKKRPIVGTVQFMSYEHVTGKQLDERTDIYALGVVVSILTYGVGISQRYIYDKHGNLVERQQADLVDALVNGESLKFHIVAPPRNSHEAILQKILYKMTAPNKHLRYESLEQLLPQLDKI